ncbi:hypothetical protein [Bowdeniella nasicola]|uniref:hypothetical protein n=1 Tax=Bowdeniella nasicola TaxID=208480 RepID=UPI001160ED77|nr:hypothetical protein [Bowdeniella nasicola]
MKKFTKHTPEQIVARLEQAAKLKAGGKTNGDIARALGVSEATLGQVPCSGVTAFSSRLGF